MIQTQQTERTILQTGGLAGAMFHESGDGLLVVAPATERILDANAKACELSEYQRHELAALPLRSLLKHEQEWQDWLAPVQQTMTYHGKDGFLLRTRTEGRWVPVSVSISRLHPPGEEPLALFALRDRRDQVEAYRRMQRTEAELRRVLVSVSDCLWSCRVEPGGRWRWRYLSPVVQKLTGRPVGLFLENPAVREQVVDPRDLARFREFLDRLAAGYSGEIEYRIVRPDGSVGWVRENVVAAPEDGGLLLHGVMADISERKRGMERDVREERERHRLDGMAALAGKVAHDVNNLVTGLLGQAALARTEAGSLEQIESLSLRLAVFCRQLGSLKGSAAGALPTSLGACLEQAAAARQGRLPTGVTVRAESGDGRMVVADPAGVVEAVERLIDNSLAAGAGEVVLRLLGEGPTEPTLSYAGGAALAWVEVRDTGPGLPEEARLFEPFWSPRGGQGLGLATVLGTMRAHKGAVHVESSSRGTAVRLGFPLAQGLPPAPASRTSGPATVLLADDEETVLDVVSRLLGSLGYKVLTARNGEEALALHAAHAGEIRLALVDLTMPKLCGDEATKRLREASASLPIVLMSGYPELDIAPRFAGVPGVSYLQKPFRLPALIDLLKKVVPE